MTARRLVVFSFLCVALFLVACGSPPTSNLPRPVAALTPAETLATWGKAQKVFETRCVVCHGCYDAPCQLKLGTFEGISRGATEAKVYDPERLTAATPTRLDIDEHGAEAWHKKGFFPVLPEGAQRDPRASVLLRMLALKHDHPLNPARDISKDFTLELDRKQTCTTADHFDAFAKDHPLWGMPYALLGLEPAEESALTDWVNAGAPHPEADPLATPFQSSIAAWETFLNEPSLKSRLVGRYIYEHLFLASIYFKDVDDHTFFRLIRSRTASGFAPSEIPTRRPFDDPKTEHVYYRFVHRVERPLEKTHMPYPLDAARLKRFHELFIEPPYTVDRLPGYEPETASNPFRAFQAIPADARYRFMLEEAEFTLMGFIKGPVCRGQVALNVIEDRFWVTFVDPDVPWLKDETAFLAGEKLDLDMPAEGGSTALPTLWLGYAGHHAKYIKKQNDFLEKVTKNGDGVSLRLIWNGNGVNSNAALTVFRHFDSATVVKGLVGAPPKTAWVIGYPLLERIHYLLVAGFDVFGNVTHQLTTRLYMDFLRMEGESGFLMFLPPSRRAELIDLWYRGVTGDAKDHISKELMGFGATPNITYRAPAPETELFSMLKTRVAPVLATGYDLEHVEDASLRAAFERLGTLKGRAASWMPETSFLTVETDGGGSAHFTLLRDSGHTNVVHLFHEQERRLKDEDDLTVVRGFLGAYPNALFDVQRKDVDAFVDAVVKLDSEADYHTLRMRFGVLRASDQFWRYSDRILEEHAKQAIQPGLFDYNRLEAF